LAAQVKAGKNAWKAAVPQERSTQASVSQQPNATAKSQIGPGLD